MPEGVTDVTRYRSLWDACAARVKQSKTVAYSGSAKAAAVDHPVPDIQTLQTFIPLNNARLAFQAGNDQESIAQAQIAISLKADPAVAYWGIGISYGRLGQWDQAISNLQTALMIDKNAYEVQTALKWAKDGLKAAQKGKLPKEPSPTWK